MADMHGGLDGGGEWRRTRLLLAHPHDLVLEALTWMLEASGFEVVARCASPRCAVRCAHAHAPDIAVTDTDVVPDEDLRELMRDARRGLREGRLVLLASDMRPSLAHESLAMEVDGVLLKSASCEDVVAGLRRVAAGDAIFPAGWLRAAHLGARSEAEVLSGRQREVLELLAEGLPNDVIAQRLFISRNTVKFHVAGIYSRLGVSNRVQAAQALASMPG